MKKLLIQLTFVIFIGRPLIDVFMYDATCSLQEHYVVTGVSLDETKLILFLEPNVGVNIDPSQYKEIHIKDNRGGLDIFWNKASKSLDELDWADCKDPK